MRIEINLDKTVVKTSGKNKKHVKYLVSTNNSIQFDRIHNLLIMNTHSTQQKQSIRVKKQNWCADTFGGRKQLQTTFDKTLEQNIAIII